MASVKFNGRSYTNARAGEVLAEQQDRTISLEEQLEAVRGWAKQSLKLHSPYTHVVDVSMSPDDEILDQFLERLRSKIWCNECSTPWPCKQIGRLRLLRDIARPGFDADEAGALMLGMFDEPKDGLPVSM